jgi:hypothetical protein
MDVSIVMKRAIVGKGWGRACIVVEYQVNVLHADEPKIYQDKVDHFIKVACRKASSLTKPTKHICA